ncbi:MAG: hypothetical protein NTU99_12035 [Pseudanabaena sp. LacPavin_0818_WC45_MAG_42_6]|nr:hypothetical protein [Pseudanabaena sp. LacPavin_0818_WC45_MAG_42_6]
MFYTTLKGLMLSSLMAVSSLGFSAIADAQNSVKQNSVCPSNGDVAIKSQISPLQGDAIDLGNFSGIQVVVLASMGSMETAQEMAKIIDLEFQYNMLEGEMVKRKPQTSAKTIFSPDFDGKSIQPIIQASEPLFSKVSLNEQALLLILNGKGQVLSAYNKLEGSDLPIRQCLREKFKLARR